MNLIRPDVPPGGSCAASCQRIAACREQFAQMTGKEDACLHTPSRFKKNVLIGGCFTPAMDGQLAAEGLTREDLR